MEAYAAGRPRRANITFFDAALSRSIRLFKPDGPNGPNGM